MPKLNEVFLIREASCPLCGTKGGYAGFSGFDCVKPGCKNSKEKLKKYQAGHMPEKGWGAAPGSGWMSWDQFVARYPSRASNIDVNPDDGLGETGNFSGLVMPSMQARPVGTDGFELWDEWSEVFPPHLVWVGDDLEPVE